jgi:ATP-dependent Clp protease ATP-binding subunit ClpA
MSIFAPDDERNKTYPYLRDYTTFLKSMERPLVGREKEMIKLLAAMERPELCNVILLANAGSGKTALVQGTKLKDTNRIYLEVDLPKMIANLKNENEMADKLKQLFDEVARYGKEYGKEIVLFIDEFHQIVQLSAAAVEVLKPLLADSGTRGIRVIAATTYIEFQDYIAANQPLVERLQRINLAEPDKATCVSILKGMAQRYGVLDQFRGDSMFEAIYEYTNRYVPANAQPRKSILMMDSMIGWHRFTNKPIDMKMLADVIYDTEGVNIAFRVDATSIKKELDAVVLAQDYASSAIENRLQICCADLNNKNKPMSSFLFTGSTGVGKRIPDDTMIPVYTEDNSLHHKRNGDLVPGDRVFGRRGQPVKVSQVFHYKDCEMLEVEFTDGRKILADPEHLWQYKSRFGNGSKLWKVANTAELMEKMSNAYYNKGRSVANVKFVIPMNQPVQWHERVYKLHPYVLGTAIGNGCLTIDCFTISSNDEDGIKRCSELISAVDYKKAKSSYSWHFYTGETTTNNRPRCFQTCDVLSEIPELINKHSNEKFIPEIYKYGSIKQRWELIRGLFDTDGTIDSSTGRYNISYSTTSKRLAEDIQSVLYSLGISSSLNCHSRKGKTDEYDLHVKVGNQDKEQFFWLERKRAVAREAAASDSGKTRIKKFNEVLGIRAIRKTNIRTDATCIMVDDEEHLYQAGDYIVTHNTEMTKQLARILFDDEDRSLIRLDMTEYALDESLERFRDELTTKVWARPYSIVLLDEIEKACPPVTRLLLQVLDDGRLIDRNNREVTFKNCYIVVTTNAGSEIYKTIAQYNADDKGSGAFVAKYEALIRDSIVSTTGGGKFPPELLGRIDCIVPFQPLSEQTMGRICASKLIKLKSQIYAKHNVEVAFDRNIIRYVVQEKMTTDSDAGGARAVISRLEREVVTPVARFINHIDRKKVKNNTIYCYVEGKMATDDKRKLESDAHIVVDYEGK